MRAENRETLHRSICFGRSTSFVGREEGGRSVGWKIEVEEGVASGEPERVADRISALVMESTLVQRDNISGSGGGGGGGGREAAAEEAEAEEERQYGGSESCVDEVANDI